MDLIRKILQGCWQHYEKIALTVALIILGLVVWYLSEESKREEEKNKVFVTQVELRGKTNTLKPIDFTEYDAAMKLAASTPSWSFSLPHNLLNPVKWQRKPNNDLLKVETGGEVGWKQMVITRVTPLNFTISLLPGATASGCFLGFTREAADKAPDRKMRRVFFTVNTTNRFFTNMFALRELKGVPDSPEVVLELLDGNEKVTINAGKPYVKVEGYEADLKYSLNGNTFSNLRVNSNLNFLGEAYNIVAIAPNEVVASAQLNDKKEFVRQTAP